MWVTEGRTAPDAVTATAAMAAQTERVRLGTSVLNPYTRSPASPAITADAIDQTFLGRLVLGISVASRDCSNGRISAVERRSPTCGEYVQRQTQLPTRKSVTFVEETPQVTDLGLEFTPYAAPIPVYIGATGPCALALAIELGDRVQLNVCISGTAVDQMIAAVRAGPGFGSMATSLWCAWIRTARS